MHTSAKKQEKSAVYSDVSFRHSEKAANMLGRYEARNTAAL